MDLRLPEGKCRPDAGFSGRPRIEAGARCNPNIEEYAQSLLKCDPENALGNIIQRVWRYWTWPGFVWPEHGPVGVEGMSFGIQFICLYRRDIPIH